MTDPRRIQLLVAFGYDGSRFRGLAPQPNLPTAAAALKDRFLAADVYPKALCFSSRTDAGVHALRNVATCWLRGPVDLDTVLAAVTAPRDDGLRDVAIAQVPIHVHARAIPIGKHYRFIIDDGWPGIAPPSRDSWCVAHQLDPVAMAAGAEHLIGAHDFASFCARRSRAVQNTLREMTAVTITPGPGPGPGQRLIIDVRGKSFLRHMVRILVGTLGLVGSGWMPPDHVAEVILAKRRGAAGPTAPACGLTLVEVLTSWPLPG